MTYGDLAYGGDHAGGSPASDSAAQCAALLERRYRHLLAWYPRAYRRENEQEILAVLMASSRPGQRRPGTAETADLIRSALWMRLSPGASRPPSTVLAAVRLLCLGAALNVGALITVLLTTGHVQAQMLARIPGDWHTVSVHITTAEVCSPLSIAVWLVLAWANGRGFDWARSCNSTFFVATTLSLVFWLAEHGTSYALPDTLWVSALWLIQLAALVLVFLPKSAAHYHRHEPAPATQ